MLSETIDRRCIAQKNTDVVQHSRVNNEVAIQMQLGTFIDDTYCSLAYLFTMRNQDIVQRFIIAIILLYNIKNFVHTNSHLQRFKVTDDL